MQSSESLWKQFHTVTENMLKNEKETLDKT